MIPEMDEETFPETRLDSWKSIAQYLDHSCRTVQRWHSESGLPVYRLQGKMRSVFAFSNELDDWLLRRSRTEGGEPLELRGPVLLTEPLSRSEQGQGHASLRSNVISVSTTSQSQDLSAQAARMWQVVSPSSLKTIAQIYRKALDLDPNNPNAFVGLAITLITDGLVGEIRTPFAYICARIALRMAMECDPELPSVKSTEAWLKMILERDWHGARQGFDEVLNQNPEFMLALFGRALLYIAEGSLPDAIDLYQKIEMKRPLDTILQARLSWCEYLAGQYETARARIAIVRNFGGTDVSLNAVDALASVQLEGPDGFIHRVESLAPDFQNQPVPQGVLGYAYALSDQTQKALDVLGALNESRVQAKPHYAYATALTLIGLNEGKKAVECLEQSYGQGSLWSLGFLSDPILTSLRSGPEFQLFLSRVTYPTA